MQVNLKSTAYPEDDPPLTRSILQILERLSDAVFVFDRSWRVVLANSKARRISGLRDEQVGAISLQDLFPASLCAELERKYRRAIEVDLEEQHDFFYDAAGLWLKGRIMAADPYVALLCREVTAQKREEESQLVVIHTLEAMLAATDDAIFYLDRSYNILSSNKRAKELIRPPSDLLHSCFWNYFPSNFFTDAPFAENYGRTLEQALPSQFEAFHSEPPGRWFRVESKPAEMGLITSFCDITSFRREQQRFLLEHQELAGKNAELEALYCSAPAGLALFDPVEFRYLRLNDRQAEFFGVASKELIGQPVSHLAPIEGILELFQQVSRGVPVREHLLSGELATRPGEHRHWAVSYLPVFAADHTTVQAISSVTLEITQLKRAEAALIQNEKLAAIGRLAQAISHEINNPLESVNNILYLMNTSGELSEPMRKYVELAQEELGRVSEIAMQTLSFHRQSASAALVLPKRLMNAVLDLYRASFASAGIVLETQIASQTPLLCQENEIRQVLNNLIANAVDAMPNGGRLLARAINASHPKTGRQGVRLTIADTGEGMSAGTQKRVFEAYYTTKQGKGTGLGMWIASTIVSKHNGLLLFRSSQRPDKHGTVFSLFLPSERRGLARQTAG